MNQSGYFLPDMVYAHLEVKYTKCGPSCVFFIKNDSLWSLERCTSITRADLQHSAWALARLDAT